MRDGDDQELGRTVGGGSGVAIAIQPDEELLRAEHRLVERRIEIAEEQLRDLRDDRDDRQLATRLKARQDRLRIAGWVGFGLVAAAALIGLAAMAVNAARSRAVVIAPFDAPTSLAAAGYSGRTVAAGVLDTLAAIQAGTRAEQRGRRLGNA